MFTQGYALFIGVGNYPYIPPLPVTVNDATVLYQLFTHPDRAGYPKHQVRLLTNQQATREGIIEGLDWLIACTRDNPNATAIIYFSGHGGISEAGHTLLAYDFREIDWQNTSIDQQTFAARIDQIESRKLLIFLDCCHAAGMTAKEANEHHFIPSNEALYQTLRRGKGRVIVASCRADQKSYISAGASYSVFTEALIETLDHHSDDGNGYATVLQTLAIVSKAVMQKSPLPQTPVFDLRGVEDFPICRINTRLSAQLPFKNTEAYLDRNTSGTALLRHKIPIKPAFFLGREDLLKNIHQQLTDRSMRQPILLLSGIGGMGKTTLMQEYLRSPACQGAFDRIVFSSVRQGIRYAFASTVIAAFKLDAIAPDPNKNLEQSFQFAVQELEKISGDNLFVIDNVNEKDYEELKAVKAILMTTGWKILVTTRTVPDGFAHLRVEELSMKDVELLFAYHFAGNRINIGLPEGREEKLRTFIEAQEMGEELDQLLTHIVRHTLLTELLAKAAATKGLSPSHLLAILKAQDYKHPDLQRTITIEGHPLSTHREHLSQTTLHNYLLSLFETEYLVTVTGDESTDRENLEKVSMLRFFSVLPSTDLPIDDLRTLWRVDKKDENPFEDRLDELRQIGWLQGGQDVIRVTKERQNLFFKMHPLVQEVVYDKLKPDTKNCRPLIQTITEALNHPGKYAHIHQSYAKGIVDNFDGLKKKAHGPRI